MRITDSDLQNTGLDITTVDNILAIGGLTYLQSRLNLTANQQLITMYVMPVIKTLGYNELEQSSINGVTVIKYGLGKQVKRITICTESDIADNLDYALDLLYNKLLLTPFRPIAEQQIELLRQTNNTTLIHAMMQQNNCLNAVYVDSNNYLYLAYNSKDWLLTVSASGLSNVSSVVCAYLTGK